MSDCPKVAVITRTHNRNRLLRRAIESVLAQSFQDWVHVILNDGGDPDALENLCQAYAGSYAGRLKLLHEKHLGMQEAANSAIRRSDSRYIVIHDDDDAWEPAFLAETTAFLEEQGPDSPCQGVISQTLRILEKENPDRSFTEIERRPYVPVRSVNLFRVGFENPFPPIAFLYRRRVHEETGFFNPRWDMVADLDFNFRFLQLHEIGVVEKPLALYYWRDSSSPSTENANTVTRQKDEHGRLLNELKNHYLRKASTAREAALGLGFQISAFAVENQWMTSEIRDRVNEARSHLQSLLERVDSLHAFNDSALWPKLTGDLIPRLDHLAADIPRLHETLTAAAADAGRQFDSLHAFNHSALWPKLTEDLLPRLDELLKRATLLRQEVLPRFDEVLETLAHISGTTGSLWERQDRIASENAARLDSIQTELAALRGQSRREWKLGRLRIQWMGRDAGPESE